MRSQHYSTEERTSEQSLWLDSTMINSPTSPSIKTSVHFPLVDMSSKYCTTLNGNKVLIILTYDISWRWKICMNAAGIIWPMLTLATSVAVSSAIWSLLVFWRGNVRIPCKTVLKRVGSSTNVGKVIVKHFDWGNKGSEWKATRKGHFRNTRREKKKSKTFRGWLDETVSLKDIQEKDCVSGRERGKGRNKITRHPLTSFCSSGPGRRGRTSGPRDRAGSPFFSPDEEAWQRQVRARGEVSGRVESESTSTRPGAASNCRAFKTWFSCSTPALRSVSSRALFKHSQSVSIFNFLKLSSLKSLNLNFFRPEKKKTVFLRTTCVTHLSFLVFCTLPIVNFFPFCRKWHSLLENNFARQKRLQKSTAASLRNSSVAETIEPGHCAKKIFANSNSAHGISEKVKKKKVSWWKITFSSARGKKNTRLLEVTYAASALDVSFLRRTRDWIKTQWQGENPVPVSCRLRFPDPASYYLTHLQLSSGQHHGHHHHRLFSRLSCTFGEWTLQVLAHRLYLTGG